MELIRLKSKNQLTIPTRIVKKLGLQEDEFFQVDIEEGHIKLMPVEVRPRYHKRKSLKIQ